ncbi:hypothetical protein [Gordonia paraffinivorans]|uniref:hypothetical protein n=1 Tax=Gordonia paraffinivorans TaxID=175628 RepID=UPI00144587B2|nr:hypothetical protein [Gordonia paraffinivorans]
MAATTAALASVEIVTPVSMNSRTSKSGSNGVRTQSSGQLRTRIPWPASAISSSTEAVRPVRRIAAISSTGSRSTVAKVSSGCRCTRSRNSRIRRFCAVTLMIPTVSVST